MFGRPSRSVLIEKLRRSINDYNQNRWSFGSKPAWRHAASAAWHSGKCVKLVGLLNQQSESRGELASYLLDIMDANAQADFDRVVILCESVVEMLSHD